MRLARRRASMKRQATQKLWCKSLYATHEFFSHVYCSMTNHETIGSSTKQVKDSLCVSDSSLVGCVLPTRLFFFFNLIWQSEQSVTSSYRPTPLISWRFSRFSARTINFGIFVFRCENTAASNAHRQVVSSTTDFSYSPNIPPPSYSSFP